MHRWCRVGLDLIKIGNVVFLLHGWVLALALHSLLLLLLLLSYPLMKLFPLLLLFLLDSQSGFPLYLGFLSNLTRTLRNRRITLLGLQNRPWRLCIKVSQLRPTRPALLSLRCLLLSLRWQRLVENGSGCRRLDMRNRPCLSQRRKTCAHNSLRW